MALGTEESLFATGTAMARLAAKDPALEKPLAPLERELFERALRLGLDAEDFWALKKMQDFARKPDRHLWHLLLCERLACGEGATCLSLESDRLVGPLGLLGLDGAEIDRFTATLPGLLEREGDLFTAEDEVRPVPFVIGAGGKLLYRHRHLVAEGKVAAQLKARLSLPWREDPQVEKVFQQVTGVHPSGDREWRQGSAWRPIQLAPEQELAALLAVVAPFTFISGGPGTGKTSIVVTILRLIASLGGDTDRVALAAPTGRAAHRLGEAVRRGLRSVHPKGLPSSLESWRPEPQTLHRLLGWSRARRRFFFNAENPLDLQWLIVDEASMVDLMLMERMLDALPVHTRLVLLGDARQLPSVEAGAVFRDLSQSSLSQPAGGETVAQQLANRGKQPPGMSRHLVALRKSFRQSTDAGGAHIRAIAARFQAQAFDLFEGPADQTVRILDADIALPDKGVTLIHSGRLSVPDFISQLYQRFFQGLVAECAQPFASLEQANQDLERLFQQLERIRVLCLTRKSAQGVERINQLFRERITLDETLFQGGIPWMITQNDYRHGVFNGDIGLGLRFAEEGGVPKRWLVFRGEGGFRRIPFESQPGLEMAFAMTVHKSQGSEADHVVLMLPEQQNALCKREVIYTALTRARKSVWIHGTPEILKEAVGDSIERASGLYDRLHGTET